MVKSNGLAIILFTFLQFGCASTVELFGERVVIESTDNSKRHTSDIVGNLRLPDTPKEMFPAVVLMHGCGGITASNRQGLNNHTNFFLENGFAVLVVDSFRTRGKTGGTVCRSERELSSALLYRQYDAFHALRFLASKAYIDSDNIFLVGQSNGGSVALKVASGPDPTEFPSGLKYTAVVAYYPWCDALNFRLVSPLLVLHAEKDDWVPPRRCQEFKSVVKGAPYEVIVYEGAFHSFDMPIPTQRYLGYTLGGNSSATEESRRAMLNWFVRHTQ